MYDLVDNCSNTHSLISSFNQTTEDLSLFLKGDLGTIEMKTNDVTSLLRTEMKTANECGMLCVRLIYFIEFVSHTLWKMI